MRRGLGVMMVLAGCAEPEPVPRGGDSDLMGSCDGGEPSSMVIASIAFARAVDGVSEGFDLDGAVTSSGDATGCGVEDQVAPDGTEGIDNSFARLLPVLELTEASAAEEVIAEAIRTGDVLLMARLTGLDDRQNDDCVTVEVLQGFGAPFMRADGGLVAGQSFGRKMDGTYAALQGTLVDGVVEARGASITLPLNILNAQLEIQIDDVAVRLELDDDGGGEGLLAGGVDVAALLESVTSQGVNDEVLQLVQPVLATAVDLEPDADGVCTRMSVTLDVSGVEAFVVEGQEESADGEGEDSDTDGY